MSVQRYVITESCIKKALEGNLDSLEKITNTIDIIPDEETLIMLRKQYRKNPHSFNSVRSLRRWLLKAYFEKSIKYSYGYYSYFEILIDSFEGLPKKAGNTLNAEKINLFRIDQNIDKNAISIYMNGISKVVQQGLNLIEVPIRDKEIFELRYGISRGSKITYNEIASKYGISEARVGQIIEKILKKLSKIESITAMYKIVMGINITIKEFFVLKNFIDIDILMKICDSNVACINTSKMSDFTNEAYEEHYAKYLRMFKQNSPCTLEEIL